MLPGQVVAGQPLEISLRDGNLGIVTFTSLKREALLSFGSRSITWAFVKRADGNGHSHGGRLLPLRVHPVNTCGAGDSLKSSTCPSFVLIMRAEAQREFVRPRPGPPWSPHDSP